MNETEMTIDQQHSINDKTKAMMTIILYAAMDTTTHICHVKYIAGFDVCGFFLVDYIQNNISFIYLYILILCTLYDKEFSYEYLIYPTKMCIKI